MPAGKIIDGRAIAEQIHQETARRIASLQAGGTVPRLVFIEPFGEAPPFRAVLDPQHLYLAQQVRVQAQPGMRRGRLADTGGGEHSSEQSSRKGWMLHGFFAPGLGIRVSCVRSRKLPRMPAARPTALFPKRSRM